MFLDKCYKKHVWNCNLKILYRFMKKLGSNFFKIENKFYLTPLFIVKNLLIATELHCFKFQVT